MKLNNSYLEQYIANELKHITFEFFILGHTKLLTLKSLKLIHFQMRKLRIHRICSTTVSERIEKKSNFEKLCVMHAYYY